MNWYQIGSYIWTGSSAAWLVLFAVTEIEAAFAVSAFCAVAALAWNLFHPGQLSHPRRNKSKSEDS